MPKARTVLDIAKAHQKRVERYLNRIRKLFDDATRSYVVLSMSSGYDGDDLFSFSDYPTLTKSVNKIIKTLENGLKSVILVGSSTEWESSSSILEGLLKKYNLNKEQTSLLLSEAISKRNQAALRAFQKRDIGGLSLMKKVRTMSSRHKIETELALSIVQGRSADETAKAVMKYINNRHDLFKSIKEKHGLPRLQKATKNYFNASSPTSGSYYDALRLARTEINMAFRNAELESFREKDWIVGYEVHRSNTEYDCPVCDALVGKYPKWVNYSGAHPNCRCYITAITYTEEEMEEYFSNGMKPIESENAVTELPTNLKEWIAENTERIERSEESGKLPYFLRDNYSRITDFLIT